MGVVRRNTADIIDGRSIRQIFGYNIGGIFGEDIGIIIGFSRIWEEGRARLAGMERDRRAQWEDGGFTLPLRGHVYSYNNTGIYMVRGKGEMG